MEQSSYVQTGDVVSEQEERPTKRLAVASTSPEYTMSPAERFLNACVRSDPQREYLEANWRDLYWYLLEVVPVDVAISMNGKVASGGLTSLVDKEWAWYKVHGEPTSEKVCRELSRYYADNPDLLPMGTRWNELPPEVWVQILREAGYVLPLGEERAQLARSSRRLGQAVSRVAQTTQQEVTQQRPFIVRFVMALSIFIAENDIEDENGDEDEDVEYESLSEGIDLDSGIERRSLRILGFNTGYKTFIVEDRYHWLHDLAYNPEDTSELEKQNNFPYDTVGLSPQNDFYIYEFEFSVFERLLYRLIQPYMGIELRSAKNDQLLYPELVEDKRIPYLVRQFLIGRPWLSVNVAAMQLQERPELREQLIRWVDSVFNAYLNPSLLAEVTIEDYSTLPLPAPRFSTLGFSPPPTPPQRSPSPEIPFLN